ncbi:hypothetical protein SBRCBS47491_004380 [Sporothrix bragantina]|uniref:Major facilitator superfamily (MFS) profile domain-containing protein n=1 Tax=Sporothrix bragantina TaxID=671064 RepID=A0ABP0BMU1_9PEZI
MSELKMPAIDEKQPASSLDMAHAQSMETIDTAVQKSAIFKIDVAVLGCFGLMYFLANLDRNNLGQAEVMGLPEDLGLVGNQFGNAVTVFYATYVAFETPLTIAMKHVGAKNLLAMCMFGWGAVCLGTGFVKNINQLYALRVVLGMFEAGLIPCINAYIGMVYLKSELTMRSAVYYCFSAIAGAFGGLLAAAVSHVHAGGLASWSWLFIIEGIITMSLAPLIFFIFPSDPRAAWFLNEAERNVMRLRYEHNRHLAIEDTFSWSKVLSTFADVKTYIHCVIEFSVDISLFSMSTFMPSIIKGMGYTSVHAQLLTVPVYVWSAIAFFIIAFLSDRHGMRSPYLVGASFAVLIGNIMMIATDNIAARYVALFFLAVGMYSTSGLDITWLNGNFAGHYKRSTAVGFVLSVGNTSGVLTGQIFTSQSAPRYLKGIKITLGFTAVAIVVSTLYACGLYYVNKKRDERAAASGESYSDNKDISDLDDTFRYTL